MFGSESYSREELIAEMGSAMLCGVAGIEPLNQSVAWEAAAGSANDLVWDWPLVPSRP